MREFPSRHDRRVARRIASNLAIQLSSLLMSLLMSARGDVVSSAQLLRSPATYRMSMAARVKRSADCVALVQLIFATIGFARS